MSGLCKVCGTPGCVEMRGADFHAGAGFGSKVCDYSGVAPFADAAWAGVNQDPNDLMCEWCAGTGHPHGDESYGMCECPPVEVVLVQQPVDERQLDLLPNEGVAV